MLTFDTPAALVTATQARFARWAWPAPVTFGVGACVADVDGALLPVLCPSEPYHNSARNVAAANMATITAELDFAASAAGARPKPLLSKVRRLWFVRFWLRNMLI